MESILKRISCNELHVGENRTRQYPEYQKLEDKLHESLTEEQWMDMDALLTEYWTILLDDACDYFVEGVQVGFGLAQDLLCR